VTMVVFWCRCLRTTCKRSTTASCHLTQWVTCGRWITHVWPSVGLWRKPFEMRIGNARSFDRAFLFARPAATRCLRRRYLETEDAGLAELDWSAYMSPNSGAGFHPLHHRNMNGLWARFFMPE